VEGRHADSRCLGRASARDFPNYTAGSWGPAAADKLLQRDQRVWKNPEQAGCLRTLSVQSGTFSILPAIFPQHGFRPPPKVEGP